RRRAAPRHPRQRLEGAMAAGLRHEAAAAGLVDILSRTMAIPSLREREGLAELAARANVCMMTPLDAFGPLRGRRRGRSPPRAAPQHRDPGQRASAVQSGEVPKM